MWRTVGYDVGPNGGHVDTAAAWTFCQKSLAFLLRYDHNPVFGSLPAVTLTFGHKI